MKKIIIWLIAMTCVHWVHGQQTVTGYVYGLSGKHKVPLEGATVTELDCPNGTIVGENGFFEITLSCGEEHAQLIFQYVGYQRDTITLEGRKALVVELIQSKELGVVEINRRRKSYGISSMDPKTTLILREQEFQKAACCNLSESFENAPAIDVAFTDAVTGTKQIKMLGLDGFYTTISREFMPAVRGLNTFYGLSFIPAAWVDGIQITKGAGSVVNGYESMAGQINIEMKKPFGRDQFMIDQFVAESGRTETDVMVRKDLGQFVATSLFGRFATRPLEMDRNDDNFLDNPTSTQYQFMNRWQFYNKKGYEGQLNVSVNNDAKQGGQVNVTNPYIVDIANKQLDVWAKLGKSFKDKPYKSFGSQYAFNTINSETQYGPIPDDGSSRRTLTMIGQTAYANFMYQSIFGNTNHEYKTGASIMADWMDEYLDGYELSRVEQVVGAYFEYTFKPDTFTTVVMGARVDNSNLFGFFPTLRMHIKKDLNKGNTSIRLSGGNGYRTPNFFGQHQHMFISSRRIVIPRNQWSTLGVMQEQSWNYGGSLQQKFKLSYMPASIEMDFFRTQFQNELLVNRETEGQIVMTELQNGTIANSFQTQFDLKIQRRVELRIAYRMFDVTTIYPEYGGDRMDKPFIAKHRGFVNLTMSNRKKWQWNITGQLYGRQRLPGYTTGFNPETVLMNYSNVFPLVSTQLSKRMVNKPFEWYVGLENVLNYRQQNPILNADNPIGPGFDAAMVWGPVFGRMAYAGFRYRLKIKEDEE